MYELDIGFISSMMNGKGWISFMSGDKLDYMNNIDWHYIFCLVNINNLKPYALCPMIFLGWLNLNPFSTWDYTMFSSYVHIPHQP